jgi:hydrogenase maturation protease
MSHHILGECAVVEILVLGLGNILRSDDGVGVRVVERLQDEYDLPERVESFDGGTRGPALVPCLEGVRKLLVVDAVVSGKEPGAVTRQEGKDLEGSPDRLVSLHQEGLVDLLMFAHIVDSYPEEVVLWGVEPAVLESGEELSPRVAARTDELVEGVIEELRGWGAEIRPKKRERSSTS